MTGSNDEEPVAANRDAAHWAKMVSRLKVSQVPDGATNLNVDGRAPEALHTDNGPAPDPSVRGPQPFRFLPCDHRRMDVASINELAAQRLATAVSAESGRSSVTVYGRPGARLRQTLMALAAGRVMGEHKSPGDASLLCMRGRVRVRAGDAEVELGPGDLVAVPPQRHDVEALEPSVLLLTVALH